jgi:hypothetical protein
MQSSTTPTLDIEIAGEIAGGSSFDEGMISFEFVASQEVSEHRWYIKRLIVCKIDGALWGFHYNDPKTEDSLDYDDRFDSNPVKVFEVEAREVTATVYEAKA